VEIRQQPEHRPQVPSKASKVAGSIRYQGGDFGIEADPESVVKAYAVDLAGIHDTGLAPEEYLERPLEVRPHPERLHVAVATADRQHPHHPTGIHTGCRHLVYRTVATDGHHEDVLRQARDYLVRMTGPSRDVPYGLNLSLPLEKGGDGSPPGHRPASVSHWIKYQMQFSSRHDLLPQDTNTRARAPASIAGVCL
jgi:hypothetical protein